jgi:hypothetical protein
MISEPLLQTCVPTEGANLRVASEADCPWRLSRHRCEVGRGGKTLARSILGAVGSYSTIANTVCSGACVYGVALLAKILFSSLWRTVGRVWSLSIKITLVLDHSLTYAGHYSRSASG